MIRFFGYKKCSTCTKAKKYLTEKGAEFEDIEITEKPPSKELLEEIINSGAYGLKDLFNTSGQMYREMNMKEKMSSLSENDLIELLSKNGKLVKRPLIVNGEKYAVGFKPEKVDAIL